MFKVHVLEKVLGQVVVNTYSFNDKSQMEKFKQMCEDDGDFVMVEPSESAVILTLVC